MNRLRSSIQVMRKFAMRAIRTSTRPFLNHPFLVGVILFVILLYRSSPFLFSLLVSASPVLVCTAVLLGTLLSFGDPQIPEIIKDDDLITQKMSSLRAIPMQNRTVAFHPNVDIGRRKSVDKQVGLSTWNSREIVIEPQCVVGEEIVTKNADHEEKLAFEASPCAYEVLAKTFENGGSHEGSVDGHLDDHDHFVESSSMPWALVNDNDDDEDEDDDSDGAEIIPLLDEIDPLIECENSINSDEESDHKEVEDEEADDADDEEENHQEDKQDAEKSAIKWTEDDQKNFMDFGSSELERNRRLESLIAKRMIKKTNNERNLIDLDNFDLPFQIPTISTTRQNPFDLPNDHIPGSAPSILLPRRNPFDLPYDSSEEKPDLTGDNSFQQEFTQVTQREPVFRRHESFHIGSSFFEHPKKDKRETIRATRLRPFFVSEIGYSSFMRQASEVSESSSFQRQTSELSGLSESSSYQRQSSDVSESKASSVAEFEIERVMDSDVIDGQYEGRDFDLQMPEIRLGESETQDERGHVVEISLGDNVDVVSSSSSSSSSSENNDVQDVDETDEEEHVSSSSSSIVSEEDNNMVKRDSSDAVDLDDSHCEEPVYDSSPRASKNNLLEESKANSAAEFELNLVSLATESTEEPESVNEDALLSDASYAENLVSVPGYVEEKLISVADSYPSDDQEESLVIREKLGEVNKTELQAVELEPSEIKEKSCVENPGKSVPVVDEIEPECGENFD